MYIAFVQSSFKIQVLHILDIDPYIVSNNNLKQPPITLIDRIKFIGPGIILSASIVGSGELIATTTLGAKAGFITFWVVIISCLVKVLVQIEFAKYTILYGKTPMTLFNELPGWKVLKINWTVWLIFIGMLVKILQVGGIIGGIAILINIMYPSVSIGIAGLFIAIVVSLLVYRGYYKIIEKSSLWMIFIFTILAFLSLYLLKYTPYSISLNDLIVGLSFQLPPETIAFALGAFGITGVGSDEILFYNYWCIEKGYASYTGKTNIINQDWKYRAKGWIKTMQTDAIAAMIIYTSVTAAFYLLGAAVLHAREEIPQGFSMLETLSGIFTESLGAKAYYVFMVGSFFILFSTLFASLAAWTRLFTDIFGVFGWVDFKNIIERKKSLAITAWVFPILWLLLFLYMETPVIMVLSGGIAGSVMLIMMAWVTIIIRYKYLIEAFKPTLLYDSLLWISIASIFMLGIYSFLKIPVFN